MKQVAFAPMLHIPSGTFDISFYPKGLGATETRRWSNDDGSVHVAEFSIGGVLFHLHEEKRSVGHLTPSDAGGVTSVTGIFVDDVDRFIERAVSAGATLVSPATDYDYGYRQGDFRDPFGHQWTIQQKI